MDAMKLFWGFLFILFGMVFIGANIGWWDSSIWVSILSLWPIILIALGLKLLISNEKTLAFSLFGLLLLVVVFIGYTYSGNSKYWIKRGSFMGIQLNSSEVMSEDLTDSYNAETIKRAKVSLSTGATKVNILALPESADKNILYQIVSTDMGKISVDKSISNDEITLDINESNVGLRLGRHMMVEREITLFLPIGLIADLKIDCGASMMNFDFRHLQIEKATLNIGASSGDIYLGNKTKNQSYNLSAGASNLNFHVPEQVGVDLNVEGGLNNLFLDSKLKYSNQPTKVTITGSAGVSNIKFLSE